MRNKLLFSIGAVFFMVFLLGNYYGPRMIIEVRNEIYKILNKQKNEFPKAIDFGLQTEPLEIITKDNLKLKAEIIRTDSIQKGTVILVHGIRAHKEHFYPVCKLLSNNGFNAVVIDLRAHGQSEGKYCTYGFKEKHELVALIDTLNNDKSLNKNFGIWGQSLGAAVALQTLEIDKQLKFGIIESTFSDFRTIVNDYSFNKFGFTIPFMNDYLIWKAEQIGDFDADKIIPSESAKLIKQPILVVHGNLDKRIKIEYGYKNYYNLTSEEKEFIEIETANHLNVWEKGGEDYFNKVLKFISKHQISN